MTMVIAVGLLIDCVTWLGLFCYWWFVAWVVVLFVCLE